MNNNSGYLIHYGVKGMKWDPSKRKTPLDYYEDLTGDHTYNRNYEPEKPKEPIVFDGGVPKTQSQYIKETEQNKTSVIDDGLKIIGKFFNNVVDTASSFINSGKKFISRLFS